MIKIVSHSIPKNIVNNWSKECGSNCGREGTESHLSPPPSGEACFMRTAPSRTPGSDDQMWTLFILFCHFFPLDWEDQSQHAECSSRSRESPARGQALCVHNLQQALGRDMWGLGCGHSGPISPGVSGPQGALASTLAGRHAQSLWHMSCPSQPWTTERGVAMHGRAWKPKAMHREQG